MPARGRTVPLWVCGATAGVHDGPVPVRGAEVRVRDGPGARRVVPLWEEGALGVVGHRPLPCPPAVRRERATPVLGRALPLPVCVFPLRVRVFLMRYFSGAQHGVAQRWRIIAPICATLRQNLPSPTPPW
ncbi:hypothetical protein [Parapedobacter sp. 2B3]|uniref:hypothetical protein n=1 Tax=Parapedobacter sp. 2B3 TaxID=3342381 RepID=UPI0035B67BCB